MTKEIRRKQKEAILRLLQLHYDAHAGHLGGNLSCLDIMVVLYHRILSERDIFLLSKGHSAGALYVALWSAGKLSEEELGTFTCDDTRLGVHPPINCIGAIPFGTGSLGHGLSLCAGMALAKKLRGEPGLVFCQSSDGESQEGSVWEALGFAAHHRLDNLRLLIDVNGWQGFGSTTEVWSADLDTLRRRLEAFGMETAMVADGHCTTAIEAALRIQPQAGKPLAILFQTRKAHRLPFFENQLKSHYLPLTDEQYAEAVAVVKEAFDA